MTIFAAVISDCRATILTPQPLAAVYDRRTLVSYPLSAVIDRRYKAAIISPW